MENASKALIMAGSVLIALMIIGALLLMVNNLSSYQKVGEQNTREAQVVEFNNQFETYLRRNVRGSDMISLMNRIVDYNTRKTDTSEERFQRMNISITGINVNNLKYNSGDSNLIASSYTQDTIGDLLTKIQIIEGNYQAKYISALSTNINEVMASENKAKEILPKNLSDYGGYNEIKNDTAKYYQYSQFKRVYFDYVESGTEYSSMGRIVKLEFVCNNRLE